MKCNNCDCDSHTPLCPNCGQAIDGAYFKCFNCGNKYLEEFADDFDTALCKWCSGAEEKNGTS